MRQDLGHRRKKGNELQLIGLQLGPLNNLIITNFYSLDHLYGRNLNN